MIDFESKLTKAILKESKNDEVADLKSAYRDYLKTVHNVMSKLSSTIKDAGDGKYLRRKISSDPDRGICLRINWKSYPKTVVCYVDPMTEQWIIELNGRRKNINTHGNHFDLRDYENLAQEIVDFFSSNYKSLGSNSEATK